jgi:hypothetical protein
MKRNKVPIFKKNKTTFLMWAYSCHSGKNPLFHRGFLHALGGRILFDFQEKQNHFLNVGL